MRGRGNIPGSSPGAAIKMNTPKKTAVTLAAVLVAGAAAGTITDVYGTMEGTAEVQEPVFYPNSTGDLNLNEPGQGYYNTSSDEEFGYEIGSAKEFYNRSANVSIAAGSNGVDFVEFDYNGDGIYSECELQNGYWICDYSGNYNTDSFSLLVVLDEESASEINLELGEDTRVEFTNPVEVGGNK